MTQISNMNLEELRDKICELYAASPEKAEAYVRDEIECASLLHDQAIEFGYSEEYADTLLEHKLSHLLVNYKVNSLSLSLITPKLYIDTSVKKVKGVRYDTLSKSDASKVLWELGYDVSNPIYEVVGCVNTSATYNDGLKPYCGKLIYGKERTDKAWRTSSYASLESKYYYEQDDLEVMRNTQDWDTIAERMVEAEREADEERKKEIKEGNKNFHEGF